MIYNKQKQEKPKVESVEMVEIPDTLNSQLATLTKHQLEYFRKLIIKELKTRYPSSRSSKYFVPIEDKIPTSQQLSLILMATDNLKYRLYFKLLALTGCRPIEAITLKKDDIDFKNQCIYVMVAKKQQPVRLAKYFPESLATELKLWLQARASDIDKHQDYVFFNRANDSHITVIEASRVFREILSKLKLDNFYATADDKNNPRMETGRKLRNYSLKSLRKFFVSQVYGASQDGMMASRLLHHEHVSTSSQFYVGISKEQKLKTLNKAFKEQV